MSERSHRDHLREMTAEALRRLALNKVKIRHHQFQETRPGDLFVLMQLADYPVELAVIEKDPQDLKRWLTVLADTNPLLGRHDVGVPEQASAGPLSLRCRFVLWFAAETLDAQLRTGFLEPKYVKLVRKKITFGRTEEEAELSMDEEDQLAYEDWLDQLRCAQRQLQRALGKK